MSSRKRVAVAAETTPHRHCYPTRWSLLRYSPLSRASRVEEKAKEQTVVLCKRRKNKRHILSLPGEIMVNILGLIPAKILHEVVRYVCKQWYDIVRNPLFIRVHCQMASPDFLAQTAGDELRGYCIKEDSCKLVGTEIKLPFSSVILCSCNGLLLLRDTKARMLLHVMNPVTKVKITLPRVGGMLDECVGTVRFTINSSGHYKVAQILPQNRRGDELRMRVFTLGVDKAWRSIDMQGITRTSFSGVTSPLSIGRFIYWFSDQLYGIALDMDTETIYQFSGPKELVQLERNKTIYNICMGTSIGLMMEEEEGTLSIWKLTDVSSGKWKKVIVGLNLKPALDGVHKVFPPSEDQAFIPVRFADGVLWFYTGVRERYVVFRYNGANECFRKRYVVVRYNLANKSFIFYPTRWIAGRRLLPPHVSTLVSPKNCLP